MNAKRVIPFVRRRNVGFALIEALVALLIFSLGMLGIIGLHANATKLVTDSEFRSEAALIVGELIAEMSVADRDSLEEDYSVSGESDPGGEIDDWVANRLQQSGLPGVTLDSVQFEALIPGTETRTVTIAISWVPPGRLYDGSDQDVVERQSYATQALIF